MGIREWLNQHKSVSTGLAAVIVVGAGAAIFVQARSFAPTTGIGKAYFTNDDGKTFFADDAVKFPPFDKDGKPAYRAFVFECNGTRTVGYMSRYTEAGVAALTEAKKYQGSGKPPPNIEQLKTIGTTGTEIKKPGDEKWISQANPGRTSAIRIVNCKDGRPANEVEPQ
jgi:hypothetical protein